ncbi:hypothetical protein LSAT2_020168, partial [Lamellibrachia satsuma]
MAASQGRILRQTSAGCSADGLTPRLRPTDPLTPQFANTRIILTTDVTQQGRQKYPIRARGPPLLPLLRGQHRNSQTLATSDGIKQQCSVNAANSRKRPVVANTELVSQFAVPKQGGTDLTCKERMVQNCRNCSQTPKRSVDKCHSTVSTKDNTSDCRRGNGKSVVKVDVVDYDSLAKDSVDNSAFTFEELPVPKELVHRCINWVREVEQAKLHQGLEPVTLSIIHWTEAETT